MRSGRGAEWQDRQVVVEAVVGEPDDAKRRRVPTPLPGRRAQSRNAARSSSSCSSDRPRRAVIAGVGIRGPSPTRCSSLIKSGSSSAISARLQLSMLARSASSLASAVRLSRWADVKVTEPGHSMPRPDGCRQQARPPRQAVGAVGHGVRVGEAHLVEAAMRAGSAARCGSARHRPREYRVRTLRSSACRRGAALRTGRRTRA